MEMILKYMALVLACLSSLIKAFEYFYPSEVWFRVAKAPIQIIRYANGKMRSVENIPEMGGGEINENDGWDEFKYDVFDIL
jgi:hypothetical protein